MRTSVVVVSHRPGGWLEPCLRSVLGQADEVIVVDNGSLDAEVSRQAAMLGARPLRSDANLGFAGGVNLGVSRANGDIVAFLNDDAVAEDGWIDHSAACLAVAGVAAVVPKLLLARRYAEIVLDDEPYSVPGDPRPLGRRLHSVTVAGDEVLSAAVGPGLHRLETGPSEPHHWRWTCGRRPVYVPVPEGSADVRFNGEPVEIRATIDLINNAGSYLSAHGYGGDYGYETPDRGAFDEPRDCFAASGAALVTSAEALHRIGPFAAAFFAYYEDTDWSWRAQLAGMRIRYEPAAVVRHLRGATTGGEHNSRVQYFAARNRLLTLARNAPRGVFVSQLRSDRGGGSWSAVRRSLLRRLPEALAERVRLARGWQRTPRDVWAEWAGVGERWPETGRQPCDSPVQRDGR